MNRYNPYTVPEDYFNKFNSEVTSKYRRCRRTFVRSLAMTALLVILLAVPTLMFVDANKSEPEVEYTTNLAEMYEYDIFLQVNF